MVSQQQLQQGLRNYVTMEICPHLDSWKRALVMGYTALATPNLGEILLKYKDRPAIAVLHVMDDQGNVDDDKLFTVCQDAIGDRMSVPLPVIGEFVFNRGDVEKLFRYIRS